MTDGFDGLPGAPLVRQGLLDLKEGMLSEYALLLLVARPRLLLLGVDIPENTCLERPIEHRFYEKLEEKYGAAAYSQYSSLIRRIVSFARALSREQSAQRLTPVT